MAICAVAGIAIVIFQQNPDFFADLIPGGPKAVVRRYLDGVITGADVSQYLQGEDTMVAPYMVIDYEILRVLKDVKTYGTNSTIRITSFHVITEIIFRSQAGTDLRKTLRFEVMNDEIFRIE